MKVGRKSNVETAFKGNLRFFSFGLAGFQIIVNSAVKIIQKFLGISPS